jgi:bifunctional non-homologous end joining protein LigD
MSPRTTKTLPNVRPILLTPRREPFNDPAWLFEPKYDGYRGLLYVTRKGCWFRSKRGNILKRFDQLCYWVREELPVKEAILDGEVVAFDTDGRQNFRNLIAGRGNLHYAAFDALWVNGKDLRGPAAHPSQESSNRPCAGDHYCCVPGVLYRGTRSRSVRCGRAARS